MRPVNSHAELDVLDVLGVGRVVGAQWTTPVHVQQKPGRTQCTLAGIGDAARMERYEAALRQPDILA
jgi:hypothetical protein